MTLKKLATELVNDELTRRLDVFDRFLRDNVISKKKHREIRDSILVFYDDDIEKRYHYLRKVYNVYPNLIQFK